MKLAVTTAAVLALAAPAAASVDPVSAILGKPSAYGHLTIHGRPYICAQWNYLTPSGTLVRTVTECVLEAGKKQGGAPKA